MNDKQRLDWLEQMANRKGGLLLHDGSESGRTGLGLKKLNRSLREAIDDACDARPVPVPPKKSK